MKIIIYTIFLFILSSSINSKDKTPIICYIINEEINKEAQWVYLFHINGNEYEMPDSCYVEEGQTEFTLNTYIEDGCTDFCWITFSKTGPNQLSFLLNKEDNIKIHIRNLDEKDPYIEGSPVAIENYEDRNKVRKVRRRIDLLTDSLYIVKDDITSQLIIDSINLCNEYLNIGLDLDRLKETKMANTYLARLENLSSKISQTTLDSLIFEMKKKFPNSKDIQMYPIEKVYPRPSNKSKIIANRYQEILNNKTGVRKKDEKSQSPINLDSISTLKLNDIIESLILKDMNDKNSPMENLKSEYIFIDFWAGWCAPCLKEIPYIKQAQAMYNDKLSIYAISFDNNKEQWRNAIKVNQSNVFTHVYGGDMTMPEAKKLCKRFGITSIPANFLLDKDRRIITVNLRGEELIKKMEELTKND